jgi:hypothetical protein
MKKWMIAVLVGVCAAGAAIAEDTVPWYKKMFGKSADEQPQVIPPAPETVAPPAQAAQPAPAVKQRPQLTQEQIEKLKARKEGSPFQVKPEVVEKMKAHHEALMKLGEAARNETDPVKKEALVAELRAKVTEGMEKMLADQKKRLAQAEADLPKLRERLADAEKNKTARIDEQVQRILSGEPMMKHHEGKHPGKKPAPAAAE